MSAEGLHRILLTGDTEGGVRTFVLELAEGLIQRGFEVFLITFGRSVSGPQKQAASAIPGLKWFHHKSKLEWMQEPWGDIQRAASLLREIAQPWHPDLVHLNTLCHGDLSWNVPVVIT